MTKDSEVSTSEPKEVQVKETIVKKVKDSNTDIPQFVSVEQVIQPEIKIPEPKIEIKNKRVYKKDPNKKYGNPTWKKGVNPNKLKSKKPVVKEDKKSDHITKQVK